MSEYLSEEEQLEQLRSFWKTWGLWLLAGVVLAVGGYGGWNWYQSYARDNAEKTSALYQEYLDAGEDADKAAKALKALEEAAAGSSYHSFVLLKQAATAVKDGKLADAEPLLKQVVEKGDEPLLRNLASLRLAAALQGLDRGDEALKLLDRVAGAGFKTAALEMKGDIHMARDELTPAHAAYKAAFEALEAGQKDSLLEAKMANAAPLPGAKAESGGSATSKAEPTKVDAVQEAATPEAAVPEEIATEETAAPNAADAPTAQTPADAAAPADTATRTETPPESVETTNDE